MLRCGSVLGNNPVVPQAVACVNADEPLMGLFRPASLSDSFQDRIGRLRPGIGAPRSFPDNRWEHRSANDSKGTHL